MSRTEPARPGHLGGLTAYLDYGPQPFESGCLAAGEAILVVTTAQIGSGELSERRGLAAGLMLSALSMVGYGLATQGWMIYVLILFGSFGGIAGPATQSLITRHIPADEQGAVQGVLARASAAWRPSSARRWRPWSFGVCVAPGTQLHLPGGAFFEAAALLLLALVLALRAFQADAAAGRTV
jgi:DHA1 family tetracycline resistance protein-like MFS transporter